ncbi:MAG: DUF1501 domain-containing protein [Pseudomonadota bacterium]
MPVNRRDFLKQLSAMSLAGTQFGLGGSALSAMAADSSGYKALVCVFLFGGLDNHDFLIPYDQDEYRQFERQRQTLLQIQGQARARESLLPLTPSNAQPGDKVWALPPEMPSLKNMFDAGDASLVANVGPLIEPVTRQGFLDQSVRLPPRLFSHNDQQATWQASAPEGAQFGWGGLFADAVLSESASANALAFSTISSVGGGPFLTGRRAFPYLVSGGRAADIFLLNDLDEEQADFRSLLERHLRGDNFSGSHLIRRDMQNAFRNALETNSAYNAAQSGAPGVSSEFPANELGGQLKGVADAIAIRDRLGVSRQIFFVGMGGFDTHDNQANSLPRLLSNIDGALGAFNNAMREIGMHQNVTLFTASDFGRTLAVNGDGTDHGWGGHHIITGGAVTGSELFGRPTPPVLDHDLDAGGGRIIPAYSVEQFAAPLGSWFGLNSTELNSALPSLRNFDDAALSVFTS